MFYTRPWPYAQHWALPLIATIVLGANACSAEESEILGFVTIVEKQAQGSAKVTIESHANKMVRREVVVVTPKTAIVRREGDTDKAVSIDSLLPKSWVRVSVTGGENRSNSSPPVAHRIVIVDRL
jgi:hypothetical protein